MVKSATAHLLMGLAAGVMSAGIGIAQAQERDQSAAGAGDQEQSDTGGLQEIIVTAQRRSESAQRVPIAILNYKAEDLQQMGVTSTADLPLLVPGFSLAPTGVGLAYFMRGVGNNSTNPGVDSEISTFVDGVYIPFQNGNLQSFNNIANIEVDKGPQGTLFGRNATGGVVQITTKDPQFTPQGAFNVGYGNYQTLTTSDYITGPITSRIAADLAVSYTDQRDGWGRNLFNGNEVFTNQDFGVRSKWLFNLSDQTVIRFALDYSRTDGDNGAIVKPARENGTQFDYLTGTQLFFPGFFNINSNFSPTHNSRQGGASLRIDTDLGWARGVSITAWRKQSSALYIDYDGTPTDFLDLTLLSRDEAESQEFQLVSPNGSELKWVVGAFLFNEKGVTDPFRFGGPGAAVTFGGPAGEPLDIVDTEHTHSYALFAQATQPIFTTTRLTLGARYTIDQRQIEGYTRFGADVVPGSAGEQSKDYYRPTWRVAFDHDLTQDLLAYISYNRGYHAGTFNTNSVGGFSVAANPPLQPETIDAYEAGLKSEWFDRRLRANVSGFLYRYSDLQQQAYDRGAVITINAASATIKGVDFDLTARVARNLTLFGSLEYLHAKFGSYPQAPLYFLDPGGSGALLTASGSAAGKWLPNAPELSYTLGATYDIPTRVGSFSTNATVSYSCGFYADPGNFYKEPHYYLVNLSAKWTSSNGKLDFSLWAKNLNNALYNLGINVLAPVGPVGNVGAPRTFGATFGFRL